MSEKVEVVGLIGEELMSSTGEKGAREVVLALPLGRLLMRMVRVPAENAADISGYLTPLLQELSPFPDEPLTVGWEVVSERESGKAVLAGALPESSADDIAEMMDAAKLRVTRLDALILGELRALWPSIAGGGDLGGSRRLLLMASSLGECAPEGRRTTEGESAPEADAPVLRRSSDAALATSMDLVVLDGDMPSAIRSIPAGANLRRETMLALLEAEEFGGALPLAEIVTVGEVDASPLAALAPVRSVAPVSVQDSLEAIALRSADASAMDLRPESWRDYLDETRFKAKLVKGVSVAVGIWLVAMGVLFGVPMGYGYMTDYQKGLSKQHQRKYTEVRDMKAKVELVRKYSDHTRGALEMIKAVSDRLPGDVELDALDFKRSDGITFSGVADETKSVYDLKDALTEMADGDENRVFGVVRLGRLTSTKGKQKFSLECRYQGEEAAE